MHFLLDANLPRGVAGVVEAAGHAATRVRQVGLIHDDAIAAHAKASGWAIMTRDFDFADIRAYPPASFAGIVVVNVRDTTPAPAICRLVESFLERHEVVARVPGRLVILEFGRVRMHPP